MNKRQLKYIALHALILTHMFGRVVSLDEAGMHWAAHSNLAVKYRVLHPEND